MAYTEVHRLCAVHVFKPYPIAPEQRANQCCFSFIKSKAACVQHAYRLQGATHENSCMYTVSMHAGWVTHLTERVDTIIRNGIVCEAQDAQGLVHLQR